MDKSERTLTPDVLTTHDASRSHVITSQRRSLDKSGLVQHPSECVLTCMCPSIPVEDKTELGISDENHV